MSWALCSSYWINCNFSLFIDCIICSVPYVACLFCASSVSTYLLSLPTYSSSPCNSCFSCKFSILNSSPLLLWLINSLICSLSWVLSLVTLFSSLECCSKSTTISYSSDCFSLFALWRLILVISKDFADSLSSFYCALKSFVNSSICSAYCWSLCYDMAF